MFIMGRKRRGFTPEYKDEAVKLVINTGRTVATVARELGLNEATLGRWVLDLRARAPAEDDPLCKLIEDLQAKAGELREAAGYPSRTSRDRCKPLSCVRAMRM